MGRIETGEEAARDTPGGGWMVIAPLLWTRSLRSHRLQGAAGDLGAGALGQVDEGRLVHVLGGLARAGVGAGGAVVLGGLGDAVALLRAGRLGDGLGVGGGRGDGRQGQGAEQGGGGGLAGAHVRSPSSGFPRSLIAPHWIVRGAGTEVTEEIENFRPALFFRGL